MSQSGEGSCFVCAGDIDLRTVRLKSLELVGGVRRARTVQMCRRCLRSPDRVWALGWAITEPRGPVASCWWCGGEGPGLRRRRVERRRDGARFLVRICPACAEACAAGRKRNGFRIGWST